MLITESSTPQAKALDGSYGGFQPKPAVEMIVVAMKPLSEKTYIDQALKNGKGITWLDNCRIPYVNETLQVGFMKTNREKGLNSTSYLGSSDTRIEDWNSTKGRFPANLICGGGIDYDIKALIEARNILNGRIPKA